jgi:type II secretory pathway pseudopilin PulG
MRLCSLPSLTLRERSVSAFTLAEVVISIAIAALIFVGIINAYIQTTQRAEWTGMSLAAQGFAVQQLEQARSAVWDPAQNINQIKTLNLLGRTTNGNTIKGYSWGELDLPISTNGIAVRATNYVTITMITNIASVPKVALQFVRVDTVWPLYGRKTLKFYTNTISTYLAPDNSSAVAVEE